ncbi:MULTISPECIES: ParB/RepB/Spo0J family partition protein [Actibacterium]|uniref:ParB family chromosome partitioning protein n=1 Tax=Actibacterium naphthalenivorans TaxID=1614693 RepID=A0A840C9S2_9RHOB|nr:MULTISPECIES: ParB/RepB/Spo0J family partition protein [Actibacterium]ALG88875.1 chromosome partitioning protein ParB [Actibacterium sp. EMB200-NS6]MBB4021613.1 ParB family chromosome partitioning protein [Actibacterium naphthalenivorans]
MSRKPEKRGLGRGLSALMADVNMAPQVAVDDAQPRRSDLIVPIEKLEPNPDQPRRRFSQEALGELAASIREKGVIQPLIVRESKRQAGNFEIVAGERRWRASQMAQLHEVPVIIRDLDDTEVLEVAIIENIQRADLNPVEEAQGYRQLMDRFGHTQEKLAEALSKSRSHIANLMRLLQLPEEVQEHLREGRISAGHARALITTGDPAALAREVIAKGLSVRETEKLAKGPKTSSPRPVSAPMGEKDADTRALEQDLSANLGMKVEIDHPEGQESGAMVIRYKTLEELDELCRVLSATPLDVSR